MAGSANRQLLELAVSHQVGLVRYGTAVVSRVVALLNRNDPDLLDLMLRRQVGAGHINTTLARVREINRDSIKLVGTTVAGEMESLAGGEVSYQDDLVGRLLRDAYTSRLPTAAVLKAVVYSKPFEGGLLREWVAGLEEGRFRRLREAVRTSIALGESSEKLVARVRGTAGLGYRDGILDISRRSASAMVRTAIAHVSSAAREEYYIANSDIVKGVRWVSVLDTRTSAPCRALDGNIYPLGKGPRPPVHIGCRSTTTPVLKSWQEMGLPEDQLTAEQMLALDGNPASRMGYSDWLALQPAAEQDAILGKAKGILFRQGSLTLDRFTDASNATLTLAQLRRRDAEAFARAGL